MSAQAGNSNRSETAVFEDNTQAKQLQVSHPQKRKALRNEYTIESNEPPKKALRRKGYAGPEEFAHLKYLTDCLKEDLDVMFCGINPGVYSATVGHHFAHKNNLFYKMIYGAGFTDRLVPPSEDTLLPIQYNIGITDLVDRPSSSESNLSSEEMIASVPALLEKVATFRPRFICFIGKGMWLKVEKGIKRLLVEKGESTTKPNLEASTSRKQNNRRKADKKYNNGIGLLPYKLIHTKDDSSEVQETLFFCSHSSSGLATNMNLLEKVANLEILYDLVRKHKTGEIDTTTMQNITSSNSHYFKSLSL